MSTIQIPFGMPGVKAEKTETDKEGSLIITVSSTAEGTDCRECGRRIDKPYGSGREIHLRHLSVFGTVTYSLKLRASFILSQK